MKRARSFTCLGILASITSAAHAATTYTFSDLGLPTTTLSGGYYNGATAINNAGQVTGYYNTSDGYTQAFVYENGSYRDLPRPTGGRSSFARSINASGVAGGNGRIGQNNSDPIYALEWNGNVLRQWAPLPGDTAAGINSINNAGQRVGYSENPQDFHPVRFTDTGAVTLPGLTPSNTGSAYHINNNGLISGAVTNAAETAYVGVWWDNNNVLRQIPILGGDYSYANSMTDNNVIIGWSTINADNEGSNAILYNVDTGVLTDLGSGSDPTYINAEGSDMNASGTVVGTNYTSDFSDNVAFVYTDGQMLTLNSLTPTLPAGWSLAGAFDINDSGQIIGQAYDANGNSHAFLLTPVPEPASLTLLTLTGLSLLKRRR